MSPTTVARQPVSRGKYILTHPADLLILPFLFQTIAEKSYIDKKLSHECGCDRQEIVCGCACKKL